MQGKEQKMIPDIRFKGYTDAWVLRKLNDVTKITMGQSPSSKNYTDNPNDNILVQGNADIKNGWVVPRVWTKQITKIGKKGDIILSVRAPVGEVAKTKYDVVLGRGVASINSNEFVYQLLLKLKNIGYWNKLSTGSTFESINSDDIKNTFLHFPKIYEQKAIGSLFKSLDELIALQQRKVETLNLLKKALLQQMFPEKGKDIPRLRFVGFSENWEKYNLKSLADHRSGTAIEKYFSDKGQYKVISIGSYGKNNKYNDQGIRAISNDMTKKHLVSKDELTMVLNDKTTTGRIIGRVLHIEQENEYVVNQRTEIIAPKNIFDVKFAFVLLNNNFRAKVKKLVQGGTQIYVNYSSVEKIYIYVPKKSEQKLIGNFFQNIDNKIENEYKKLKIIRQVKQSLLQKLFI